MVKVFDWQVRQIRGIAVIDLIGDIESGTETSLSEAFDEALRSGKAGILLNFTQAGYFNSYGIAMIIRLLTRARKSPTRMGAYGLSKHYQNLFRITRLTDFIPIFLDENSAIIELMGPPQEEKWRTQI
jgi:anti-sigma B factor antagonist